MYNTILSPGERLRALRTSNGLTLQELADRVNRIAHGRRSCNRGVVSDQELGRKQISQDYAELYAAVLGCEPDFLTGEGDYATPEQAAIFERTTENKGADAVNAIINIAGYRLDEEPSSVLDGVPELLFYGLYKSDGSRPLVALTQQERNALYENVIDAVQTCLRAAVRSGQRLEDRIESWDRLQRAAASGTVPADSEPGW